MLKQNILFKKGGSGVYAFVLKGEFTIAETNLQERDGFGIWDTAKINLKANTMDAEVLLMEVPMLS